MPKPEDIETHPLGVKDRTKLDAIATRIMEADRLKAQAAVLRESAREELFNYLDGTLGVETNAVYCVSEGALEGHRLTRHVSYDRVVNVDYLSKIVPVEMVLKMATVPVGALEGAIAAGLLGKGILSRVIESKDEPVQRCKVEKPSPKAKVQVAPGTIASWDVEAAA